MLQKAINEMKIHKVTKVWAVTTHNHPFWSNVFNKSFTLKFPAHKSVTGSGYVMDL